MRSGRNTRRQQQLPMVIGGTIPAVWFVVVTGVLTVLSIAAPPTAALLAPGAVPSLSSTSTTTSPPSPSPRLGPGPLCSGATGVAPGEASLVDSVKNLRPVVPGCTKLFRSATLDDLTEEDARRLLDGSAFSSSSSSSSKTKTNKPLALVIDLRNADEIAKGKRSRTPASEAFYNNNNNNNNNNHNNNTPGSNSGVQFLTVPVLGNVDAFWEEAIASMDPAERFGATLRTVVEGGALDRAAARHLEKGGLPLLYALMMTTGGRPLAEALEACLRVVASSKSKSNNNDSDNNDDDDDDDDGGGVVIFHCQKGKDRTGILAMLLQVCLCHNDNDNGSSGNDYGNARDKDIIEAYARSGPLIGELPNQGKDSDDSSASSTIDWSYFRGSPAGAMEETLAWTHKRYGSVEGYLDSISFGEEKRALLRSYCQE